MIDNFWVAPHVGAWIEILVVIFVSVMVAVAPHVGAWIEIKEPENTHRCERSRTPRGCVD